MSQASTGKIIMNDYAAFLLTIGGPIALAPHEAPTRFTAVMEVSRG